MSTRKALHFVFKIGNRPQAIKFFKEILGMKVLRHEEFDEGCKAACNGPYDGKWSKTMIGYGPEDDHFVMELTYNYGVNNYKLGNDFLGITLQSSEVIENAKRLNWPTTVQNEFHVLEAPGGYKFYIVNQPQPKDKDPVIKVRLACENLKRSINYWNQFCGMKITSETKESCVLGYSDNQCKLELMCIDKPVDHAKAFGRIAFSCPRDELPGIEKVMKDHDTTILTPLLSLDTPGKATVEVVILADPDGHEICFVGDEAFRELSRVDPKSDTLLEKAMAEDKSDEWFAKKGITKAEG